MIQIGEMNFYFLFCVFCSYFSFLENVWNARSAWGSRPISATNWLSELGQLGNQSVLLVSSPVETVTDTCVLLIVVRIRKRKKTQCTDAF